MPPRRMAIERRLQSVRNLGISMARYIQRATLFRDFQRRGKHFVSFIRLPRPGVVIADAHVAANYPRVVVVTRPGDFPNPHGPARRSRAAICNIFVPPCFIAPHVFWLSCCACCVVPRLVVQCQALFRRASPRPGVGIQHNSTFYEW